MKNHIKNLSHFVKGVKKIKMTDYLKRIFVDICIIVLGLVFIISIASESAQSITTFIIFFILWMDFLIFWKISKGEKHRVKETKAWQLVFYFGIAFATIPIHFILPSILDFMMDNQYAIKMGIDNKNIFYVNVKKENGVIDNIRLLLQIFTAIVAVVALFITFINFLRKSGDELFYMYTVISSDYDNKYSFVDTLTVFNNKDKNSTIFTIKLLIKSEGREIILIDQKKPIIIPAYSSITLSLFKPDLYNGGNIFIEENDANSSIVFVTSEGNTTGKLHPKAGTENVVNSYHIETTYIMGRYSLSTDDRDYKQMMNNTLLAKSNIKLTSIIVLLERCGKNNNYYSVYGNYENGVFNILEYGEELINRLEIKEYFESLLSKKTVDENKKDINANYDVRRTVSDNPNIKEFANLNTEIVNQVKSGQFMHLYDHIDVTYNPCANFSIK